MFLFIGEKEVVDNFLYFYIITTSTVGYGDYSPSSDIGKMVTMLWLVPGGILIFTAILGRIVETIQKGFYIMKNGMHFFDTVQGHIVIVGYQPSTLKQLMKQTDEIFASKEKVVVTTSPKCEHTTWVKADSYSDVDAYERANVEEADRIVIMLDEDSEAISAMMTIRAMLPDKQTPKIIAYIHEPDNARIIRANFPDVNVVVSNKVNYISRSMVDPGISELFETLTSSVDGHTLYKCVVGKNMVGKCSLELENEYNISVIAYIPHGETNFKFTNSSESDKFIEDDVIYYIGEKRIG